MRLPRLRFLIPFAAAIFLSLGANSYVATQYSDDQRIAKITWKAACRISNYEVCPKKGPAVRRSPILGEMASARGAYWLGSSVIWLDKPLSGTQVWLTVFHEQIHYLQTVNGVTMEGYDQTLRCLVEREALELTNAYVDELGAPRSYKRTVEVWRKLYGCTPNSGKQIMGH